MNTILLASDGSPSAGNALQFAIELCRSTGAHLEVLTVRTRKPHGDPDGPHGDHMDLEPVVDEIAADAARTARDLGIQAEARTVYGSPAQVIAQTAKGLGADLIVVGSHGRDRLASAVLGSVSLGLLSSADIPVTVVRYAQTSEPLAVSQPGRKEASD